MATAITHVLTWLRGEQVGEDSDGNVYYQERRIPKGRRRRRWVVYKGPDEASRIPPEWHAWLHYTVDAIPDPNKLTVKPWQQDHLHNRDGCRVSPPGTYARRRAAFGSDGDYQPWTPN